MMIAEELKLKTLENHIKLEQTSLLCSIHDKTLTKENYIYILKKFYGFFYPLESKINTFTELKKLLPDLPDRRKAAMLKQDISAINGEEIVDLHLCTDLPQVNNASQALGCLYVMEGSTLGGKIIYKTVEAQLGLDNTRGASFFYGYGAETGHKWKAFQQALNQFSEHYQTNNLIVEAANQTFIKLEQWVENNSF